VSLLEAIVLGIVQGLTEFLPISSTAHLRIVPAMVGWEDPGAAFTAVTQLGTMGAVLLFFREDLLRIARAWLGSVRRPRAPRSLDARLGWYIVLGTIPIGIFGLIFEEQIESGVFDGGVSRCRATTRKGKPCQRAPLPEREYCPSHQHLETRRAA